MQCMDRVRHVALAWALVLGLSSVIINPIVQSSASQRASLPVYVADSGTTPNGDGGGGHIGG